MLRCCAIIPRQRSNNSAPSPLPPTPPCDISQSTTCRQQLPCNQAVCGFRNNKLTTFTSPFCLSSCSFSTTSHARYGTRCKLQTCNSVDNGCGNWCLILIPILVIMILVRQHPASSLQIERAFSKDGLIGEFGLGSRGARGTLW